SQYEALGIVGVNLIHAALAHYDAPELVIESLSDNLNTKRIEVDMIKFTGPQFQTVDHRLMSLKLVQQDLSDAAMFAASGEVLQPSEVLYKKPVLVERGSFRPVTHVNLDMLECARSQFVQEPAVRGEEVVTLMELTMNNLMQTGEIDYQDFLSRAEVIAATGATVLISDYLEYYRLAAYLARYTDKQIAMSMGVPSLRELFDESYYANLDGGILESFGRLFKNNMTLYVYPFKDRETGQLTTVERLKVPPHLSNLFEHLRENNYIRSIDYYNKDFLPIFSRDVLAKIGPNDQSWEAMVPPEVARVIKERKFFGYQD
nr:TonB-dependent receptor [Acidobacteriota bacterium]